MLSGSELGGAAGIFLANPIVAIGSVAFTGWIGAETT
jgi:hypothetical protein